MRTIEAWRDRGHHRNQRADIACERPDAIERGVGGRDARRDTRPNVGFSPATLQQAAGPRIEPPVSAERRIDRAGSTSEAEPLDEPPGMRVASCGLTGVPV